MALEPVTRQSNPKVRLDPQRKVIIWNGDANLLLTHPERITLSYDRAERVIAIRAATPSERRTSFYASSYGGSKYGRQASAGRFFDYMAIRHSGVLLIDQVEQADDGSLIVRLDRAKRRILEPVS